MRVLLRRGPRRFKPRRGWHLGGVNDQDDKIVRVGGRAAKLMA